MKNVLTRGQTLLPGERELLVSDVEEDHGALVLAVVRHRRDEVPDDVVVDPPGVAVQLVPCRRTHRGDRRMVAGIVAFPENQEYGKL